LQELNIKNYAHIGDAVYEVFIREKTILLTSNLHKLHKLTVGFVNAKFQTDLLAGIMPNLTEKEIDLVRRARNIQVSTARRIDRALHATATSLEVLLGYNYMHDKARYNELCKLMEKEINFSSYIQ